MSMSRGLGTYVNKWMTGCVCRKDLRAWHVYEHEGICTAVLGPTCVRLIFKFKNFAIWLLKSAVIKN